MAPNGQRECFYNSQGMLCVVSQPTRSYQYILARNWRTRWSCVAPRTNKKRPTKKMEVASRKVKTKRCPRSGVRRAMAASLVWQMVEGEWRVVVGGRWCGHSQCVSVGCGKQQQRRLKDGCWTGQQRGREMGRGQEININKRKSAQMAAAAR